MDVDIVWNSDPLEYFKHSDLQDFDILFQDDGARSIRFAPYAANSGFYFARHNERTRYFFISMLYHADYLLISKSHQQLMSMLLPEMNSSIGLRVKTIQDTEIPGGFHFLSRKEFIRDIVTGKTDVLAFLMHWTSSIEDKLHYMRQMGMWYLQDDCSSTEKNGFMECCSTEPIIQCKYLDLPSVATCKGYDGAWKNSRTPFWK